MGEAEVLSSTTTARLQFPVVLSSAVIPIPALSKKEIVVTVLSSNLYLASCCQEKLKPPEWSKSEVLPPSCQIKDPSEPDILYIQLVCRDDNR